MIFFNDIFFIMALGGVVLCVVLRCIGVRDETSLFIAMFIAGVIDFTIRLRTLEDMKYHPRGKWLAHIVGAHFMFIPVWIWGIVGAGGIWDALKIKL